MAGFKLNSMEKLQMLWKQVSQLAMESFISLTISYYRFHKTFNKGVLAYYFLDSRIFIDDGTKFEVRSEIKQPVVFRLAKSIIFT